MGIVVDVTNGRVNTIEGNLGDAVRRRNYKIGDSRIMGMEFIHSEYNVSLYLIPLYVSACKEQMF